MSDLSNPATFHGVPIRHTCTGCGEIMNCDHYPPGTNVVGSHDPPTPEEMKKLRRYQREDARNRKIQLILFIVGAVGGFLFLVLVILKKLGMA